MRACLPLLVLLGVAACQQAPETAQAATTLTPACSYDAEAMLALDVDTFDSTPDAGWRTVANIPGCEAAGAGLLATYREQKPGLSADDVGGLLHHEFQLRAASGQDDAAKEIAQQLISLRAEDDVMRSYHEAELAFLARDLEALTVARDRLAAVPKPDGFEAGVEAFKAKYPDYPPPVWPINLDVVDGFITCFDKPYAEAYTLSCRPGREDGGANLTRQTPE
nr:hypothetical protein [uncultured Hyphomonas sp.]